MIAAKRQDEGETRFPHAERLHQHTRPANAEFPVREPASIRNRSAVLPESSPAGSGVSKHESVDVSKRCKSGEVGRVGWVSEVWGAQEQTSGTERLYINFASKVGESRMPLFAVIVNGLDVGLHSLHNQSLCHKPIFGILKER